MSSEELFALALVKNLRANVPPLSAVCAALYETKEWAAKNLQPEVATSVAWEVHFVLQDVIKHAHHCSLDKLHDHADRIP